MIQRAEVGQNSQSQINGAFVGLILGIISGAVYAGIGGAIAGGVFGLFLGGLVGSVLMRFGRRTATVVTVGLVLIIVIFIVQNIFQSVRSRTAGPTAPRDSPSYDGYNSEFIQ
jgi:O-antigen ligase